MSNKNTVNRTKEAKRAVIIEHLASKYGVTKVYARFCIRGKGESETAELILNEYKVLRAKVDELLPTALTQNK